MTTLIRGFHNLKRDELGTVLTMGNFDGVHLGHQALIKAVSTKAKEVHSRSMVITFEPLPQEYFGAKSGKLLPRITRFKEKYYFLQQTGVDHVLQLTFNQSLANTSASVFANWLATKLNVKHVIVGADFHFGAERKGDVTYLADVGKKEGFSVETFNAVTYQNRRISSTWVREALNTFDPALIPHLLGHPYMMFGRVRGGDQRGRLLGFPTANIYLHRTLTPVQGVYTVLVHHIQDKPLPGVANIGIRPTVDGTQTLLEVHLLDFNQDIYGYDVQVEFCEKLRNEERYPSLDLLKLQIAKDVKNAVDYFKKLGGT